jgi:hypothetical protein
MATNRYDTEFSIRYAVRLHERGQAFWDSISKLLKFISLASGSAALVAVIGSDGRYALAMGLVFAFFQAIEHSYNPADRKYEELAQRKAFSKLYAKAPKLADDALDAAYRELVAEDESTTFESLRQLAYNDVARETGSDASYYYKNSSFFFTLLSS